MQHVTDYLGHIDVEPALNPIEVDYLRSERFLDATANRSGAPMLWCPWVPNPDGRRLSCPRHDTDLYPVAWLRYLIAELLKPRASGTFRRELAGFSFDHVLDGMVVGRRRDGQLFAITATRNRVRERVLRPAPAPYVEPRPAPSADEPGGAKVIPLRRYR
jgi:hypothetical protein